jgi:hypothetical protein
MGKLDSCMLKTNTRTMLTSVMLVAWDMIHMAQGGIGRSEAIGIDNPEKPYAGFVEKMTYKRRLVPLRLGEALEWAVNGLAMKLGYDDGEISGYVADQLNAPAFVPAAVVAVP